MGSEKTERKEIEDEIHEKNEEMRERVRCREREKKSFVQSPKILFVCFMIYEQ